VNELPFVLTGRVIPGKQLGSQLGFPTANIAYDPADRCWPAEGVYAGLAEIEGDGTAYVTVLNQGRHPTAPGGAPTVEAHLLDYCGDPLYGRKLRLTYCLFLRPETRFPTLEALRKQLAQDCAAARRWAGSAPFSPHSQRSI